MRCWVTVLIGTCCLVSISGCAGFLEFHNEQMDRRETCEQQGSRFDALWKGGYGFNNPNVERRRQGLEPVNFDGKTDREKQKKEGGYFDDLFGDMIFYSIKSTFTAIASKFKR